jgi:hypothetical protein
VTVRRCRYDSDVTASTVSAPGFALEAAYLSSGRVKGLTHELYRYPARFSPELVRTCLAQFSNAEDYVLDPFVGGGTSAVEALVAGRRFAGFDLNPLSLVLTRAKTTPLYRRDKDVLRAWIERAFDGSSTPELDDRLRNAPDSLVKVFAGPVAAVRDLPRARQRDAARALLLHVGQWALDGRQEPAPPEDVRAAALETLDRFLVGVDQLMGAARAIGVRPSALPTRRVLRCEPASRAARGRGTARLRGRFRLVVTSPPYPGVHVLYHRWQVRGRSETAMPYWLADESDGLGPKHYTMGGRTKPGIDLYFGSMQGCRDKLLGSPQSRGFVFLARIVTALPLDRFAYRGHGNQCHPVLETGTQQLSNFRASLQLGEEEAVIGVQEVVIGVHLPTILAGSIGDDAHRRGAVHFVLVPFDLPYPVGVWKLDTARTFLCPSATPFWIPALSRSVPSRAGRECGSNCDLRVVHEWVDERLVDDRYGEL